MTGLADGLPLLEQRMLVFVENGSSLCPLLCNPAGFVIILPTPRVQVFQHSVFGNLIESIIEMGFKFDLILL